MIPDALIKDYVPPQGIHDAPCRHCPSAQGSNDPECAQILTWPHSARVETAFACAWRNTKHCKGYCDLMGITEQDLLNHKATL